ncbi:MAG: hypothetical protein L0I95_02110, partial [Tetragenococcus koreensis]|nr:hypothetical protein [Tetragenococcus koreensis]MDN6145826.1 hypothetical protein [Tetragenococcus koreensis]
MESGGGNLNTCHKSRKNSVKKEGKNSFYNIAFTDTIPCCFSFALCYFSHYHYRFSYSNIEAVAIYLPNPFVRFSFYKLP